MDLSGKHASNPYRDITHKTLEIQPSEEGIDQILSNYEQKIHPRGTESCNCKPVTSAEQHSQRREKGRFLPRLKQVT